MIVPSTPEEEISVCRDRVIYLEQSVLNSNRVAPKVKHTLLHLANRLAVLGSNALAPINEEAGKLLTRVCDHLDKYFPSNIPDTTPIQDIVDELFDKAEEGERGNSSPEQEAIECLKRMGLISTDLEKPDVNIFRDSLIALEKELIQLRSKTSSNERTYLEKTTVTNPLINQNTSNEPYTGTIPRLTDVTVECTVVTNQYARPITTPAITSDYNPVSSVPRPSINPTTTPYPYKLTEYASYDSVRDPTPYPFTQPWFNRSSINGNSMSLIPTKVPTSITPQSMPNAWPNLPYSRGQALFEPTTLASYQVTMSQWPNSFSQSPPTFSQTTAMPQVSFPVPPQNIHPSVSYPNPYPPYNVPPCMHLPDRNVAVAHKTLPVSLWKIEKYSGTDRGTKLNEFLALVEQLALSERVSEQELFDSAFHLFEGPAKSWYMSMRHPYPGRLMNWHHLVWELKRNFAHPELDALLRFQIYQRRQQRNETFQDYYFAMDKMFRSMMHPMEDREKLDIVKRNLRNDYKKSLLWQPIFNLPQLIEAGHVIDSSNFAMYNQVFAPERAVNLVTQNNPVNSRSEHSRYPRSNQNRNENWREKPKNTSHENYPFKKNSGNARSVSEPKKTPTPENQPGPSRPRRTIDYLVDGFTPPPANVCLNCRQVNHQVEECRSLNGLICFICGFKGFDTQNCPYCQKNGRPTLEKRRESKDLA